MELLLKKMCKGVQSIIYEPKIVDKYFGHLFGTADLQNEGEFYQFPSRILGKILTTGAYLDPRFLLFWSLNLKVAYLLFFSKWGYFRINFSERKLQNIKNEG